MKPDQLMQLSPGITILCYYPDGRDNPPRKAELLEVQQNTRYESGCGATVKIEGVKHRQSLDSYWLEVE